MTLTEAILAALPEASNLDTSSVIRKVETMLPSEQDRSPKAIVDALEGLCKQGIIAHTMAHSMSMWRKRTYREYCEALAVRDGRQKELL